MKSVSCSPPVMVIVSARAGSGAHNSRAAANSPTIRDFMDPPLRYRFCASTFRRLASNGVQRARSDKRRAASRTAVLRSAAVERRRCASQPQGARREPTLASAPRQTPISRPLDLSGLSTVTADASLVASHYTRMPIANNALASRGCRRGFQRPEHLPDELVQRSAAANPPHDGDDIVLGIDVDDIGAVPLEVDRRFRRARQRLAFG